MRNVVWREREAVRIEPGGIEDWILVRERKWGITYALPLMLAGGTSARKAV